MSLTPEQRKEARRLIALRRSLSGKAIARLLGVNVRTLYRSLEPEEPKLSAAKVERGK